MSRIQRKLQSPAFKKVAQTGTNTKKRNTPPSVTAPRAKTQKHTLTGDLIRRHREIWGFSQTQLAKKLNLGTSQLVVNMERGTHVLPNYLIEPICQVLSMDTLLFQMAWAQDRQAKMAQKKLKLVPYKKQSNWVEIYWMTTEGPIVVSGPLTLQKYLETHPATQYWERLN